MTIRFCAGLLLLSLAVSLSPVWGEETPGSLQLPPVPLERLLEEARESNPQIRAAKHRWKGAQKRIIQAAWLEDPKVSYTYFGEEVRTRVGPQEQAFGVSQNLPFPTKLYLRGKAASQEAKALEQLYLATEFQILTRVKQVYYELFWARKAIEITEQDKALLEHLEQVARSHVAAHGGRQQDVSKAQVEISKAIDRLLVLRQRAASIEAHLNSLLARPPYAPLGPLETFPLPAAVHELPALQGTARTHRQEILSAGHRFDRDKTQVNLARWRYLPDLTVGFNYIDIGDGFTTAVNDGTDAWNVMFSFNVPIWEPVLRANLQEAQATADVAQALVEQAQFQTQFEVSDAHFRWETAKNLEELYRTAVIPQAEQALDTAEAAYRAGEADFLNLLDSERVWLNAQITYWRAYADVAKHFADLERAAGKFLMGEQ